MPIRQVKNKIPYPRDQTLLSLHTASLSLSEVSLAFVPFCHLGEGHHLTGLPPAYLFLLEPELVGEPKLLTAEDDPPTCLRGAFAPTAITDNSVKHEDMEP